MLIAQISDTHIKSPGRLAYGRVDSAARLAACVRTLEGLAPKPDLVVLTGDLVDLGLADEYAHLRSLLAPLSIPFVVIAGNHDQRDNFRAAFADQAYLPRQGFLHFAIDDHPLRIVGLDTLLPGQGGGILCQERLEWLDDTLSNRSDVPTMILMHHPPFATGIAHMDRIGLQSADAFAAIVARHPQVVRICCGHLHRMILSSAGGRCAVTAPSPSHQVMLDLSLQGPSAFCLEPPGFLLHWWNGSALVTHHALVDAFEGPYPFFDEGGHLIG